MRRIQRRAVSYIAAIALLLLVASVLYYFGVRRFEPNEGDKRFVEAVQFVVETFTATGYGAESPWESLPMNVFVIVLDLVLAACFFLGLPAVFLPLFRDALESSPSERVPEDRRDHVVVCTYSERMGALAEELQSNDVAYALVEPDPDRAIDLEEAGHEVVHGDPQSIDTLERANLADARALVADVSDRIDASIVLTAREISDDVRIVSVVEDPDLTQYHRRAGADAVVTPRTLLGDALARKVTTTIRTDLDDAVHVGEDFEVVEFPVHHGGRLAGTTLADSDLAEQYDLNVIGVWRRGEFDAGPGPETTFEPGTVLLLAGPERGLERLREDTTSTVRRFASGQTLLAGYGMVGTTVSRELSGAGFDHTIVDSEAIDGVDVVGDVTDPDVLREAGIETADSFVLAVPDDTATEFATLVARDLNPSIEIVARVESSGEVRKTYAAGADYVLSLSTVSGRLLAAQVLEDEAVLSPDTQVELVRTTAPKLAGQTLAGASVRARTGCTVVAVERNGEVYTDLGPEFRLENGDDLVIAGTDEDVNRFLEQFA